MSKGNICTFARRSSCPQCFLPARLMAGLPAVLLAGLLTRLIKNEDAIPLSFFNLVKDVPNFKVVKNEDATPLFSLAR
jgi:hypothetical protein